MRAGVFINYRSEDSHTCAPLIARALAAEFGRERVFLDSDSIEIGDDFVTVLLGRLARCSVLLAVVGPRWLTASDEAGRRRIDLPEDWVRRELIEAFRRRIRVVPVLTDGATLPAAAELPAEIAEFSRRQYLHLRHRYVDDDLTALVRKLTTVDRGLAALVRRPAGPPQPRSAGTEAIGLQVSEWPDPRPAAPAGGNGSPSSHVGSGVALPVGGNAASFGSLAASYFDVALANEASTTGAFWKTFTALRQLARQAQPALVLPLFVQHTNAAQNLLAHAREPARSRLLKVASRYAEYTGWMAQECGRDAQMRWWTHRAGDLGIAVGDHEYHANTLLRLADAALYRDDARQTVELARQAQDELTAGLRLRALAAQREAQGHALAGDYDRCRRALDRAMSWLDQAGAPGRLDRALGSSIVVNPGNVVWGWCLLDLGEPELAAEILAAEVAAVPESGRRTRARFGTRLALAYATAGNLDAACASARQLLDDIHTIDSATIRVDLRRLLHELSRQRGNPDVRELIPRLTAVLHTPLSPA